MGCQLMAQTKRLILRYFLLVQSNLLKQMVGGVWIVSNLTGFCSVALPHTNGNNIFCCLVESRPVKSEICECSA